MASIGEQFAEALAEKDFGRVAELLDPEVDFRALTPRKAWKATGPAQVISEVLEVWFGESDRIDELISVETGEVIDRERVAYRFRGHDDDGSYIVEQQAYLTAENGRIVWMRVLCSGMRPV
jgi:hypothetical protein